METLQEIYFGKQPILPLQLQINKVREKLRGKPITTTTNLDPEIIKFNRMVESFFGFTLFSLYIQPDHSMNAYAFPVDAGLEDEDKIKIRNSIVASPDGFRYNKEYGKVSLVVAIHSGLLDADSITNEEIMATLLHEIGHGFFEAVCDNEGYYSLSRKISTMILSVNNIIKEKIKSKVETTSAMVDKELSIFKSFSSDLKYRIRNMFRRPMSRSFSESMADNMNKKRLDYTNEKFADSFAAMYGYGEECHSVDAKIRMSEMDDLYGVHTYSKLQETLKMYKLYIKDMIEYCTDDQDEHPADLARIKTTADYIKRELSKEGLDPKLKNELVEELNKVNKLIEDYKNFPKDKDSMRIRRLYYIKLCEKFGGDRREPDADNNALFDTIDRRYEEVKESTEILDEFNLHKTVSQMEDKIDNFLKIKKQWEDVRKTFIERKWTYRFIEDENTLAKLKEAIAILGSDSTNYTNYKKAFHRLATFMGLPSDGIVIDDVKFDKYKGIDRINIRFSKGLKRIEIPEGVKLYHVSPVDGIESLRPVHKSKPNDTRKSAATSGLRGSFLYPNNRVYFTLGKEISARKAGLEKTKVHRYTPKENIQYAYIDPACSSFGSRAVYIMSDTSIPVVQYE